MPSSKSSLRSPEAKHGFSLVLSLVVMAMLLLLCISAAALLAIELRVSRATVSYSKARLNAIAGARIALGTLQGLAGTDRAITANAAILATDSGKSAQIRRPRLPGVWRSGVVSSGYDTAHAAAFKGWLMSGSDASGNALAGPGATNAPAVLNWMSGGSADKATDELLLLDGGKLPYSGLAKLNEDFDLSPGSREPLSLYARPEYIAGASAPAGSFAWVAMDENQKARADLREFASSDASRGGFADNDRAVLSGSAAVRFHPGNPADGATLKDWSPTSVVRDGGLPGGWVSLPLDPNGKQSGDTSAMGWFPLESDRVTPARALRHDFTLESGSLLTDTINGGLKRDINTMALMSDGDFTGEATARFGDALGLVGTDADRSGWYAASAAPAVAGLFPLSGNTAKVWPTWADVRQWAKLSTDGGANAIGVSGGAPYVTRISWAEMKSVIGSPATTASLAKNAAWRQPVLSRIRMEVALQSRPSGATNQVLYFKLNTVAQVWNPFNVRMKMPLGGYYINMKNLPFISKWYNDATATAGNGTIPGTFYMAIPLGGADMEPGEIRTFSLPSVQLGAISNYTSKMIPGYSPTGGYESGVTTGAIPSTATVSYATGRFVNPAEIPAGNTPAGTNSNGTFYIFASDTDPADGNTAPTEVVTTIGALDGNWIVAPGNVGATKTPIGTASSIPANVNPVVCSIFEYRLKSEKLPVTPGRFAPPPLMYQGGWSWPAGAANRQQDLRACPFELVGWNPNPKKDDERFANSLSAPAPVAGNTGGYAYTGNQPPAISGMTNPVFYHLPLTPPVGLGDLRNARLGGGLRVLPSGTQDAYANAYATVAPFANSLANAHVPLDKVYLAKGNLGGSGGGAITAFAGPDAGVRPADHSWVMNTALADTWFASSLGNWNTGATATLFKVNKSYETQFRDFFIAGLPLPNRRLSPIAVTDAETKWVSGTNATKDAYRQIAQGMLVEGGFNINSTSTRAWRAFLGSSRDSKTVKQLAGVFSVATSANTGVALPASVVNEDPVPAGAVANAVNNAKRVNGGRDLSDTELDDLAVALVAEVKLRGPFLSLGEFLNRRVETGPLGYKGAVQAAIDKAKLNDYRTSTGVAATAAPTTALGNPDVDKVYDYSGVGQPGWLSQADFLAPLLPAMTPRGDTFTIRVAGESDDGARAYCEITVRRTYAFVDGRDTPDTEFNSTIGPAQRTVNKAFGRRFAIVSQRWISRDDI